MLCAVPCVVTALRCCCATTCIAATNPPGHLLHRHADPQERAAPAAAGGRQGRCAGALPRPSRSRGAAAWHGAWHACVYVCSEGVGKDGEDAPAFCSRVQGKQLQAKLLPLPPQAVLSSGFGPMSQPPHMCVVPSCTVITQPVVARVRIEGGEGQQAARQDLQARPAAAAAPASHTASCPCFPSSERWRAAEQALRYAFPHELLPCPVE